jgi:hypothetical protein
MSFSFRMSGVAFVFMTVFSNAYSLPGESIVLDPNTGDYLITYYGDGAPGNKKNKPLRQTTFVPATKINPVIGSTFRLQGTNIVVYNYRVSNGSTSRQPLISLRIDPVSDIVSSSPLPKRRQDVAISGLEQFTKVSRAAINIPQNWDGRVWISEAGGLRISWGWNSLDSPNAGLIAGSSQEGFGFSSKDIPGVGIAQFEGNTPVFGYPDGGPDGEISDQVEKLRQNNYVPRNAAVPTIAVPVPFDAAILLDRIRAQMLTWTGMQLLDPAFATQLNRYMVAAANAYRSNQPKAGKEEIESVRKLLEHEHQYLDHDDEDNEDSAEHKAATRLTIDRLAARVLDFDLRYVLKRMEHEHDKGDERKGR